MRSPPRAGSPTTRARLGIDAGRLAVGGDSAGGNLAAVVALDARDRGGPPLVYQVLIYPGTDMRMGWPSLERHAQQLPLHAGRHALVRRPLPAQRRRQGGLARFAAAGREPRRACRRRSSSPPASIRCATRARPTPRRCARPACRSRTSASRARSTAFVNMGRIIADAGRAGRHWRRRRCEQRSGWRERRGYPRRRFKRATAVDGGHRFSRLAVHCLPQLQLSCCRSRPPQYRVKPQGIPFFAVASRTAFLLASRLRESGMGLNSPGTR